MDMPNIKKEVLYLVHEVVGATCLIGAGLCNLQNDYKSDEKVLKRIEALRKQNRRINDIIDTFYRDMKEKGLI